MKREILTLCLKLFLFIMFAHAFIIVVLFFFVGEGEASLLTQVLCHIEDVLSIFFSSLSGYLLVCL